MKKEYEMAPEDDELRVIEKFNSTKKELLTEAAFEDIFYEEEELNFD